MNYWKKEPRKDLRGEGLPQGRKLHGTAFSWQDRRVKKLIRERYTGHALTTALAVYDTFTDIASLRGAQAQEETATFSAPRDEIAAWCGKSVSTIMRYARDFMRMNILYRQCRKRGKENSYNLWVLLPYPVQHLEHTPVHNSGSAQAVHNSERVKKEELRKRGEKKERSDYVRHTEGAESIGTLMKRYGKL
ncbi:hypothetical protein HKL94_00850 [Candidatus Parcubacteria bacterium]|nr:hypothetical protein [Candidatus Parcubacteria bacterium]